MIAADYLLEKCKFDAKTEFSGWVYAKNKIKNIPSLSTTWSNSTKIQDVSRFVLKTPIKKRDLYFSRLNDVSHWVELGTEPGGAREKIVLQNPETKKVFLLKFPKYGQFEIETEIFNGILANELLMKHVLYFPAVYKGKRGVICQSFIDALQSAEELWEMKGLICRHTTGLKPEMFGREIEVLREHNLTNIRMIIEEEFGQQYLNNFFEMVGFDALIGHGDRHWSNYGFKIGQAKDGKAKFTFAPIYDTAAGYLTEIPSESLHRYLGNELRDPLWYRPAKPISLSKITIEGRPKCNHFDLVAEILARNEQSHLRNFSRPILKFNKRLPKAILSKFFKDMEPIRQAVIERILVKRYEMLIDMIKDKI